MELCVKSNSKLVHVIQKMLTLRIEECNKLNRYSYAFHGCKILAEERIVD